MGRGTDLVCVDTNVLVPLFLNEPHSAAAAEWYAGEKSVFVGEGWCIPGFAIALHLACAEAADAKHMATLDDVLGRHARRLKIEPVVLRSAS